MLTILLLHIIIWNIEFGVVLSACNLRYVMMV